MDRDGRSSSFGGRSSPTLLRPAALADQEEFGDIIPDAEFSDTRPSTYFRSLTQQGLKFDSRELEHDRRNRIRKSRGALQWLPMHSFSNDLVYAMWYFVWGSIFTTVIPIVPLVALSENMFWETPELAPKSEHIGLYAIMVFCGICWTLASWVFGRAVETDPPQPLLSSIYCCATDELFSTWLMFLGVAPGNFIFAVYVYYSPQNLEFKLALVASLLCTILTLGFVYFFLPRDNKSPYHNFLSPFLTCFCMRCPNNWLRPHVQNDLLVVCWLSVWGCFVCCAATFVLTVESISVRSVKDIYDYSTLFVDCFIFLIGSLYFTAASYPGEEGRVSILGESRNTNSNSKTGPLVGVAADSRAGSAALEV